MHKGSNEGEKRSPQEASRNRKARSRSESGRAGSRAEKRIADKLKQRVELALEEADASSMVYDLPSRRRAASWMTRLASGNTDDLRSNLFREGGKVLPYQAITERFDAVYRDSMSTVDARLVDLIWSELEEGNREKIGPKSMFRGYFEDGPKKLQAVMSDKAIPAKLDMRALHRANDRLVSEIPAQSVRLYDVETVINTLREAGEEHDPESPGLDGTTNSGPPFYKSGWKANPLLDRVKFLESQHIQSYITTRAKKHFASLSRGEEVEFWAMVGQRIVNRGLDPLHDDKVKRLILALEKSEAVLWKMFTPQVQQALRGVTTADGVRVHVAWCDSPAVDASMQLMLEAANKAGRVVLSGDVSSFDASVVPKIWEVMAKGMSSWIYKGSKFFYTLNLSDIRRVRVLSPLGVMKPVPSSIKSGSGGTNFIDSQYNKLAMYYGEELGLYKLANYAVQGDDFVCDGVGVEPKSISEAYSHLNLSVHPDKQTYVAGALGFLQRLHVRGMIGGIASVYRTLASTLVYEQLRYSSKDWNPYMEAIQAISKLENAGFHPAFEALVTFVREGDKYKLGSHMSPSKVIQKAGEQARDLLAAQGRYTLNAGVLDRTSSGFDRAVTNGVLRGESLPSLGSLERFLRVYGEKRINKAAAEMTA